MLYRRQELKGILKKKVKILCKRDRAQRCTILREWAQRHTKKTIMPKTQKSCYLEGDNSKTPLESNNAKSTM